MLLVNEIFKSIQGESSFAGLPCVFIRLTGCNLRCKWCDTEYAYTEGEKISNDEIFRKILSFDTKLVEFTGGEPLLQKKELIPLMKKLLDNNFTVLVETNGSVNISDIPEEVVKIVDIKLPGSEEYGSFDYQNLNYLQKKDEIKLVISSFFDYNISKEIIKQYSLDDKYSVIMSRVFESEISLNELAEEILKDNLNVRLQLQIHKYIWKGESKGK